MCVKVSKFTLENTLNAILKCKYLIDPLRKYSRKCNFNVRRWKNTSGNNKKFRFSLRIRAAFKLRPLKLH